MTKVEQPVIGIVNDEEAVRESLRFLLEVAGHAVATFASAADLLEADTQEFTCVILDDHMPRMTGLELAERLRADGIGIPIILITSSPSPTKLLRAAELGIDRVLERPVDYEDLHDFANATRFRFGSPYPVNSDDTARLSQGLPIFLNNGSETDFRGWHGDRRNIELFPRDQFPAAQPPGSNEAGLSAERKSAQPKAKPKPNITPEQMAAVLAGGHRPPKQQTEAVSGDLMAMAASDDASKPEPASGTQAPPLTGSDAAAVSSRAITPVIDAEGSVATRGRSGLGEQAEAAGNAARHKLIAERAYELWEHQGRPHGYDVSHWLEAEHKLIAERAYALWENQGRPHGYALTHWLAAEQAIKGGPERGSGPRGGEPAKA
jgi:CheY-like chemotaxis protein